MKIWAYVALLTAITGFIILAYNNVYDAGVTSEKLICTLMAKDRANAVSVKLNTILEREREAVEAADNIAKAYHNTIITQVESNAKLQKELSEQSTVSKCIENDEGIYSAVLSVNAIRLLNECSDNSALPASKKEQGFVIENEVTTTDLARYACTAINEYNKCAIEVNSALEEINVEMKNHDRQAD